MVDLNQQLNSTIASMVVSNLTLKESVKEFRKRWIVEVLEAHRGNCTYAARELRMHRNTLSRQIEMFGIDVDAIRQETRRSA